MIFFLPFCYAFFFLIRITVVAMSNHTYWMSCCLPGVQSRKAITPIASKYPEDLQYRSYFYDTCFIFPEMHGCFSSKLVTCDHTCCNGTQSQSAFFFYNHPGGGLKAANMHRQDIFTRLA